MMYCFHLQEGTGRVVMWREMGITNSYTMESTFCGSVLGHLAGLQFRSVDLERMGYNLCDTILDFCDPDKTKVCGVLYIRVWDYPSQGLFQDLGIEGANTDCPN